MKLYSKPGACSTADHIALQWTRQPFDVELMTRETLKSPAYLEINPAGAVPALVDGEFKLTQNAAILGYIADSYPAAGLGGEVDLEAGAFDAAGLGARDGGCEELRVLRRRSAGLAVPRTGGAGAGLAAREVIGLDGGGEGAGLAGAEAPGDPELQCDG